MTEFVTTKPQKMELANLLNKMKKTNYDFKSNHINRDSRVYQDLLEELSQAEVILCKISESKTKIGVLGNQRRTINNISNVISY